MILPYDWTRCMGRESTLSDAPICPKRNACERYRAAVMGDWGPRTPSVHWMCDTADFNDRIKPITEGTEQ